MRWPLIGRCRTCRRPPIDLAAKGNGAGEIAPALDLARLVDLAVAMPADPAARRDALLDAARQRLSTLQPLSPAARDVAIAAMAAVPREAFVPAEFEALAYLPMAGDIGCGQTISHPYIVAAMTAAVAGAAGGRALDVGTGSGYQAAILAQLMREVVSVEIVPELAGRARARLLRLGYDRVKVMTADAAQAKAVRGKFDAIVVAAGADTVPPPLLALLARRGRLVMPVGARGSERLLVLERCVAGFRATSLGTVSFVPLTGLHGRREDAATAA